MQSSALILIRGTVVQSSVCATTAHVVMDIGGSKVTASMTNAAVDDLALEVGKQAYAVIKASDVMVAVD